MSERPEREWAAAKAMYEAHTGKPWPMPSFDNGISPEVVAAMETLTHWVGLARLGMDAADEYSRSIARIYE